MTDIADPDVCRNQIRLLLSHGSIDQAAQRAILEIDVLDPPRAAATAAVHFIGLAVRYAAQGNQAAALESLETALDLAAQGENSNDLRPRLYRNVAASLAEAGDYHGAAQCLEAGTVLSSDSASTWHELGVARLHSGDPEAALQALNRAQRIKPSAATSTEIALTLLDLDSSPQSARRVLGRLTTSQSTTPSVRWEFAYARASALAGDRSVALARFHRALEHADGDLTSAEHTLAEQFVRQR